MVTILHQADWHAAVLFLAGTLTRMTLILLSCYCVAQLLPRHAALRHSVLLAALLSVLAMPVLVASIFGLHLPRMTLRLPVATPLRSVTVPRSGSHASAFEPYQLQELDSVLLAELDQNSHLQSSHGSISIPQGLVVENAVPSADTTNISISSLTRDDWAVWLAAFISVWAIGAVLRTFGIVRSFIRLRHLVKHAGVADYHQLQALVDEFRQRFRFEREIVILSSTKVTNPLAVGVVRNCIVLPAGLTERLSSTALKAVIFHEAAHLQRRDHIVVLLQEVLGTVLWWHPLVFIVNRELTRAREEVCDNYVLQTADADTYSEALLTISRFLYPTTKTAGATPLWGSHWKLESRVSSILDERRIVMTSLNLRTSAIVTTLCLGISLVLATTGFSLGQESFDSSDKASEPVSPVTTGTNPLSPSPAATRANPRYHQGQGNVEGRLNRVEDMLRELLPIVKKLNKNEKRVTDQKANVPSEQDENRNPFEANRASSTTPSREVGSSQISPGPTANRYYEGTVEDRLDRVEGMLRELLRLESSGTAIPKKMRVYSVSTQSLTNIAPGDRVDVCNTNSSDTSVLLRDVLVFAVQGSKVSLVVSPRNIAALIQNESKITLRKKTVNQR